MPATAPTPEHPDAALLAYEAELEALVIEWQELDAAWPRGKTARGYVLLEVGSCLRWLSSYP